MELKHATQAAGEDAGNGEIGKAAWNEAHQLTMASGKLVGRSSNGAGDAEEISLGNRLSLMAGTLEATPSGADTQIQLNDGGAFGADAGLSFNKTTGSLTVGGKAVTTSNPVFNLSQTWNAGAVAFTGLTFNVTDTASAAASLLLDLQVSGVSKFNVTKAGVIRLPSIQGGVFITPSDATTTGFGAAFAGNNPEASVVVSNTVYYLAKASVNNFRTAISLSTNTSNPVASGFFIYPDAVNTLAQRNGVNAQTSRLYGTYTDASNYRRLAMSVTTGGVVSIKPEGAGTGATGNVLNISGLPTTNPGPGILWNNAGVVNVGT